MKAMWGILLALLSSVRLSECLVATTEWQEKSDITISLPEIPYTLQIETEWTDNGNDLVFMLKDAGNVHIDQIAIEVVAQTLTTTSCAVIALPIKNRGSGIWTIDVDTTKIKFSLNGELIKYYQDPCLMNSVRDTRKIEFGNKDDISKRFRLRPGPCIAYPSDWNLVKPMSLEEEIDAGTKVTVECEEPRVNKGSSEVTCVTGDQWQFEEKPDCALQCTGFNTADLPNMSIASLPAFEGTVLKVTCFGGTFQLGGNHVTCVSGDKFSSDKQPDCRQIGSSNI
ncbi:uncharacterized protein LOC134816280 [Bolinopsis microptera]|uniref:uncharacterized protein LOC134816280 n=1 Tax=Bolinopsis microptera TaxID=2820187 RepID=UPI003079131F